jgi:hypothetical protein
VGREEKAAELGVKPNDEDWPHRVKVVTASSPRAPK